MTSRTWILSGCSPGTTAATAIWCAQHAIEWNLHLYRHEPHKPIINLEAMYDAQGERLAGPRRTLAGLADVAVGRDGLHLRRG